MKPSEMKIYTGMLSRGEILLLFTLKVLFKHRYFLLVLKETSQDVLLL
jgi:hypothetical protein